MTEQIQLAPHNVAAEEAILGSALINSEVMYELITYITADSFFIIKNSMVWTALVALHERKVEFDTITVIEELHRLGQLEDVGGAAYITYLINNTPTHIHHAGYGDIVSVASKRRQLLAAANEIAQAAIDETSDINTVFSTATQALSNVTSAAETDDVLTIGESATARYADYERMYKEQATLPGIATGIAKLDEMTTGFKPGQLIVIAGCTGSGKTALALSIALNCKANPAIFSLEMSREEITDRFISIVSGVNLARLRRPKKFEDDDWSAILHATQRLDRYNIHIDPMTMLTPAKLLAKARRLVREKDTDVIILDYLQLMRTGIKTVDINATAMISYLSRECKMLAMELKIPVILLSQLNRAVDGRQDKHPHLSDLKLSGSIEQDADIVLFVYRDILYNENTQYPNRGEIIVAKQRQGPLGTVYAYYDATRTLWQNLAAAPVTGGYSE